MTQFHTYTSVQYGKYINFAIFFRETYRTISFSRKIFKYTTKRLIPKSGRANLWESKIEISSSSSYPSTRGSVTLRSSDLRVAWSVQYRFIGFGRGCTRLDTRCTYARVRAGSRQRRSVSRRDTDSRGRHAHVHGFSVPPWNYRNATDSRPPRQQPTRYVPPLSLSSSHVIKPLTRACSRFSKLKQERGEWLPFQESSEIWEKLNSCDVRSHFILLPLLFSRNFFRRYRRTRSAFVCAFSLNRLKCTRISKS